MDATAAVLQPSAAQAPPAVCTPTNAPAQPAHPQAAPLPHSSSSNSTAIACPHCWGITPFSRVFRGHRGAEPMNYLNLPRAGIFQSSEAAENHRSLAAYRMHFRRAHPTVKFEPDYDFSYPAPLKETETKASAPDKQSHSPVRLQVPPPKLPSQTPQALPQQQVSLLPALHPQAPQTWPQQQAQSPTVAAHLLTSVRRIAPTLLPFMSVARRPVHTPAWATQPQAPLPTLATPPQTLQPQLAPHTPSSFGQMPLPFMGPPPLGFVYLAALHAATAQQQLTLQQQKQGMVLGWPCVSVPALPPQPPVHPATAQQQAADAPMRGVQGGSGAEPQCPLAPTATGTVTGWSDEDVLLSDADADQDPCTLGDDIGEVQLALPNRNPPPLTLSPSSSGDVLCCNNTSLSPDAAGSLDIASLGEPAAKRARAGGVGEPVLLRGQGHAAQGTNSPPHHSSDTPSTSITQLLHSQPSAGQPTGSFASLSVGQPAVAPVPVGVPEAAHKRTLVGKVGVCTGGEGPGVGQGGAQYTQGSGTSAQQGTVCVNSPHTPAQFIKQGSAHSNSPHTPRDSALNANPPSSPTQPLSRMQAAVQRACQATTKRGRLPWLAWEASPTKPLKAPAPTLRRRPACSQPEAAPVTGQVGPSTAGTVAQPVTVGVGELDTRLPRLQAEVAQLGKLLGRLGVSGTLDMCEPRSAWLWDTDEWEPAWMCQEMLHRVSFDAPDVTCLTLSPDEEALIGREWRALQTAWRAAERRYACVLEELQQGRQVQDMNSCAEIVDLRMLVEALHTYVSTCSAAR